MPAAGTRSAGVGHPALNEAGQKGGDKDMEVQVAKFREVLDLLKPAVPRNPTVKSLVNILVKDGKAVATDLETMVIATMPETDGVYLIPYKDITKLLQYTHGGEYLNIKAEKDKVRLGWSDGSATFPMGKPEEFPEVPQFKPTVEAELDSDTLIPALSDMLFYASTETSRPTLAGVTVVLGDNTQLAAGDGFRMAYKELPLTFPKESAAILPSHSVNVLEHLWRKTPRTPPADEGLIPVILAKKQVKVGIDGKDHMSFGFGDSATALVNLVKGNPPDWLKLVPKDEPVLKAQVFAPELELAVRRVLQVALEGSKIVRIAFNDSTATVSAKANDQEIESKIQSLAIQGANNRFGVNALYLLNYLNGKNGIVSITVVSETAPITFQHKQDPKVLIMPMSVDW